MNDTMKKMERMHRRKKIIIISSVVIGLGLIITGYLLWRSKDKTYSVEEAIELLQNRTFDPITEEESAALVELQSRTYESVTDEELQALQLLQQNRVESTLEP